jgi:hypothetical protein
MSPGALEEERTLKRFNLSTLKGAKQIMNANLKRAAAIGSLVALIFTAGCTSLDTTVSYDDEGNSMPAVAHGQDILQQMHQDSQAGGE